MEKITNKRTEEEIEEVKEKINETAKKINQGEFIPNPGKICDFCSYRIICEAWQ
jgi:DNA helicase-2/ATP-dependent DNA helicase PcrA